MQEELFSNQSVRDTLIISASKSYMKLLEQTRNESIENMDNMPYPQELHCRRKAVMTQGFHAPSHFPYSAIGELDSLNELNSNDSHSSKSDSINVIESVKEQLRSSDDSHKTSAETQIRAGLILKNLRSLKRKINSSAKTVIDGNNIGTDDTKWTLTTDDHSLPSTESSELSFPIKTTTKDHSIDERNFRKKVINHSEKIAFVKFKSYLDNERQLFEKQPKPITTPIAKEYNELLHLKLKEYNQTRAILAQQIENEVNI